MELSIMDSSAPDAENRYMDLVKTQHSMDMLSIKDFVRAINYDIDTLIIDEQWSMLNSKRPNELITLTPKMLERLNFSRIPNLIQKLEQLFPVERREKNEYWGDGINVSIKLYVPNKFSGNSYEVPFCLEQAKAHVVVPVPVNKSK